MDQTRALGLLEAARVARLATLRTLGGPPRLVPIAFALVEGTLVHAVDHKPKTTRRLARLADLAADPRASVLADGWDDADWSRLWWVRVDGCARVLDDVADAEAAQALDALAAKYAQHAARRPEGPVVVLDVERVTGWMAADG